MRPGEPVLARQLCDRSVQVCANSRHFSLCVLQAVGYLQCEQQLLKPALCAGDWQTDWHESPAGWPSPLEPYGTGTIALPAVASQFAASPPEVILLMLQAACKAKRLGPSGMGDYDRKAADLVAKADKKLKPNFLGLGIKYEDDAELLEKAGNQFKLAKNFKAAGDTFGRLAEVQCCLYQKSSA